MIIVIAALALSALSAPPKPLIDTNGLPAIFAAACLDGMASLSPGEARSISVDDLPPDLRERLGSPTSGQAWKLQTGRTYLYLLSYEDRQSDESKICGLASDTMSLHAAADAVEKRVAGYVGSERLQAMQWLMPEESFVAIVTKAGDFNIAQINWLTERGRAALSKQVRHVTP